MNSIKNRPSHLLRNTLLISVGVILVIAIYTSVAYAAKIWPFTITAHEEQTKSTDTNKTVQEDASNNNSVASPEDSKKAAGESNKVDAAENSPSDSVIISTAAQDPQDNNILRVRAFIPSVVASGTCTLSLTMANEKFSFSTGIQPGPSTSTCEGFDISLSQNLIKAGTWIATVKIVAGAVNAVGSQEVIIK